MRVLEALRRHHILPTPLLFPFWSGGERANYNNFQDRLTLLFNETTTGGPFLIRPAALNPEHGPNPEPAWYALSAAGYAALQDAGGMSALPKRDSFHHRAMGGCIAASFELLAPRHGMRAIHLDEILAHQRCPSATRRARNPLQIRLGSGRLLEPDGLLGIHYRGLDGGSRYTFFAREDDRGTESFVREDKLQSSIRAKLDAYCELFAERAFEHHFGLPNLRVLFSVVGQGRLRLILDYLEGGPMNDRFLFKSFPDFARHRWRAPRAPIVELFEPWLTIHGPTELMPT